MSTPEPAIGTSSPGNIRSPHSLSAPDTGPQRSRPGVWNLLALSSLAGVTAVWGGTFVLVKDAVSQAPAMDFLAVRFLIAAAVLLMLRPRRITMLSRAGWGHGILLGLALGVAYIAQTYGLRYTSASLSGFITGMFVVFTPVIAGLVLRHRITRATWAAVGIAVLGLGLMSVQEFAVGPGELLTLMCALFLALHIVGLGEWSSPHDAHALTTVQLGVVAAMCLVVGVPDGLDLPADWHFWVALIGMAVIATSVAYMVQTWAQARVPASQAAVVLTLEPVFAGIFGVVFDHDQLTAQIVLGAALMVCAMYLAELRS
ncbi:DMT family transporter [Saccharopolyspora shandongensis]|uniref:DMT family transporter n=1 Tax=Saccharopolyspora shandongensis TaxID=418495 RepID=UPI00343FD901